MTEARMQDSSDAEQLAQVCSVRVGQGLYGVPIEQILEIVAGVRLRSVPLAPSFVAGLVHYRGDVLTTVSLRQVLGLAEAGEAPDLLVLEGEHGPFGLSVDAVCEVLTASSADFEANPTTLRTRRGIFTGAYKLESGLMLMLSVGELQPQRLAAGNPHGLEPLHAAETA